MKVLVNDAISSRHPLHVASADLATTATGVAMLQFALIRDGHGFKSLVRMAGPRLKVRPLTPAPPPFVVGIAYRKESSMAATVSFVAAAMRAKSK